VPGRFPLQLPHSGKNSLEMSVSRRLPFIASVNLFYFETHTQALPAIAVLTSTVTQ